MFDTSITCIDSYDNDISNLPFSAPAGYGGSGSGRYNGNGFGNGYGGGYAGNNGYGSYNNQNYSNSMGSSLVNSPASNGLSNAPFGPIGAFNQFGQQMNPFRMFR